MSNPVFKTIQLTGTSPESIEDAVNTALAKAGKTVRQMRWFEIAEVRGAIDENQVKRIQDNASKTRLSILFYSLAWDALKIAESATHVLAVFEDSMPAAEGSGRLVDPSAQTEPSTT